MGRLFMLILEGGTRNDKRPCCLGRQRTKELMNGSNSGVRSLPGGRSSTSNGVRPVMGADLCNCMNVVDS